MKRLLVVLLALWFMLPAGAMASQADTLIWGRGGDSVNLDLAQATDGESIKAGIQVLENLVIFGKDSMDVEPQLAESWSISEDGLTWTFKLRHGVTFHDGEPFNAQAVYDSFARIIDETHPLHGYGKWRYLSLSLKPVTAINVVDDYTIQLVTKKPFAPLLNNLALWLCPILSPKAMHEYKDQIGQHPVGTGPFKFVKWVKDDQIVFERNDDYWGDKAKVKQIVLKSIPEPSARLMALQSGAVDIADDLDPDSIKLVEKNSDLTMIKRPSVNVGYLALNTEKPYLKDPKVRIGLSHAIDKNTIIQAIFQGMAIPAKNPFAPSIWSYNDAIKPYDYDPVKAKKMLQDAGFDFTRELELWAMPVSRAYMPDPVKTAELIQAYLSAVGVKAKIVRMDWGTYLKKTSNGEHDMCMLGWLGGNADPDNFLYGLLSADTAQTPGASNVALWKNAEFTKLCKEAQVIFDKKERTQRYLTAQEIAHNEAPWIPLAHTTIVRCYNKRLSNVPLRPNGLNSFQMVSKN
ncbi:MAG: ABC transporter substrate-binding protein [Desulfotignum sp.]|nr:ABC transporter substrate-binding protein [Desulfotignum sp.]MCF8087495.1 ABC transporter substrate-binding protein [Desulfotignum sp.]MCF8138460.1 ABC transporter substrate-binding protein [Desulfotignum sp.]